MSTLETVAITYDLSEAVCLKSYLDSQGIPTFIDGYYPAHMNWGVIGAIGGVSVRVMESDADDVRAYLSAVRSESTDCQSSSERFRESPIWNGLQLVLLCLLIGTPPLWRLRRSWDDGSDPDGSVGRWAAGLALAVVIGFLASVAVLIAEIQAS